MDIWIGESFVGDGNDAAHINTVVGKRSGPVGVAWATALATPRQGHVPFMAVLRPGLAAKPLTLFVNKATVTTDRHGELTWGAAQAGVAAGVADAVAAEVIDSADSDDLLIIAAVWVNPQAADEEVVFANNREATFTALRNGKASYPPLQETLDASADPWNPFFRATGRA